MRAGANVWRDEHGIPHVEAENDQEWDLRYPTEPCVRTAGSDTSRSS